METIKNVAASVSSFFARKPSGPKVRYAVVAAGWISQGAFMPAVAQTNNSILTALVTDDQEKYTELAKQFDLKSYKYDEFERMLEEDVCDAIYVATPNWMHKQFAVPALEKGYHVLLEKPMEVTEEASRAIIAAAERSKAKLMIAYRLHCEPGTLCILDRVRKGDIGDPRIFSSVFTQPLKEENHRGKNGFDAGPIPDMGPYPINAVRNLFGSEPTEVVAVGFKTPGKQFELEHDTIAVTLRFPGDRVAQFTVSYSAAPWESYQIVGSKGEIEVSPCYLFGPGVKIAYRAKIEGKEESKEFPEVDHFAGETEYFSDCILNDQEPEPNGEEGLRDIRVIMAIKKALETGQMQKLAPLAPRAKRMGLDQKKELKLAPQPKHFIGRDSEPPAKSQA